jgi:hypothetical protein
MNPILRKDKAMKLISVNIGRPRPLAHQGRVVSSGIFKEPVAGPVFLQRLNLDGDGQADLRVHGGLDNFAGSKIGPPQAGPSRVSGDGEPQG